MSTAPKSKPPNAYLLNVSVENLRCFGERQTLDLSDGEGRPARWTVILGDNGVGKTSLLQAIALLGRPVTPTPAVVILDSLSPMLLSSGAFSRREHSQAASVGLEFLVGRALSAVSGQGRRRSLEWQRGDSGFQVGGDHPELHGWQCYGYGALRRIGRGTTLSRDVQQRNSETLFSDYAELINAEEWLLQADYAAAKDKDGKQGAAERLDLIKRTLVDLLPDVQEISINDPKAVGFYATVVFRTIDGECSMQSLGLGYRTTIAWLVDLAARMVRRYPDSANPIAEPAVVLVDEIDLHLHPAWQRTLMTFLSERFVNTQFIVTAHSPVVVQAAAGANIAVLRREGDQVIIDQRARSIQGWRVDQLLTSDLFDLPSARAAPYDDLLSERRGLLEKRRLTGKDKARLRILDDRMKELPAGDHPDDAEALRVIREAADLIKRQGAAGS